MFTIITNDATTYYLVWDGPHTRGVVQLDQQDVTAAVNAHIPAVRIRNSTNFTIVYNVFAQSGDQSGI